MTLEHEKPFYRLKTDEEKAKEKREIFTISLNLEEYQELLKDMQVLNQSKPSTALKQLWQVGRNVLHDQKTGRILRVIFANSNRNKKTGINDVLTEIESKVTQKELQL